MPELIAARTISPPDWMGRRETQALLKALGGEARFVGGCVRNALLGVHVDDIDLATPLKPDEVIQKLEAANIRAIPTGIEHGTITAVIDRHSYEITTLRKDVETHGRRATVAFTQNWREDAARRDFTMNTLLADERGNIFDPLGSGLDDLESRRVLFVGDAKERIAEDYLRILRFFRFHALYGAGEPDTAALEACAASADKIALLSKERITQEFLKIMASPAPQEVLALMFAHGVLREFDFEAYEPDTLKHLANFQQRYALVSVAARMAALAGFAPENISVLTERLIIPKVFQKDMAAILGVLALPGLSQDHAVKVAIYKYGRTATAQALMIELATDRVMNGYTPQALNLIQNWDIPDFPVSGDDLIAQGHEKGPALGARLQELEDQWIGNGFRLSK